MTFTHKVQLSQGEHEIRLGSLKCKEIKMKEDDIACIGEVSKALEVQPVDKENLEVQAREKP